MDVGGFAVPMASTAAGPSARCARPISPTVAAGALPMDVDDDILQLARSLLVLDSRRSS
jgi:hypothetical protein